MGTGKQSSDILKVMSLRFRRLLQTLLGGAGLLGILHAGLAAEEKTPTAANPSAASNAATAGAANKDGGTRSPSATDSAVASTTNGGWRHTRICPYSMADRMPASI